MSELIKKTLQVSGMHCAACELFVEKKVGELDGVKKADAKLGSNSLDLEYSSELNENELISNINKVISKNGYSIVNESENKVINWKELGIAFLIATLFAGTFLLLEQLGIANVLNFADGKLPLSAIFLVGIVASLSTCMAVVGGLVLTISSNFAKQGAKLPLVTFHISRIVGFFLLGGLVGLAGSLFKLSIAAELVIQIVLFLVMFIMGLSQLNIISGLGKFQPRMPKSLGKKVLSVSTYTNNLIPILLGVLTFILPCGFTQSMQFYALSTGTFIDGALTMFVFALGTLPVLGLISFASVKLAKSLQSGIFFKTAGFLIVFFAVVNLLAVVRTLSAF